MNTTTRPPFAAQGEVKGRIKLRRLMVCGDDPGPCVFEIDPPLLAGEVEIDLAEFDLPMVCPSPDPECACIVTDDGNPEFICDLCTSSCAHPVSRVTG